MLFCASSSGKYLAAFLSSLGAEPKDTLACCFGTSQKARDQRRVGLAKVEHPIMGSLSDGE